MDWFRMYSEARNDAKLRSLTDSQHRVWFNLICFANEQEDRGQVINYDAELLAVEVASGDIDLLKETLERLQKLRIIHIEDSKISFINFKKRQYENPSDTPEATKERKRKQRERDKVKSHDNVTSSHEQSRLYSDTDTDTEIDNDDRAHEEKPNFAVTYEQELGNLISPTIAQRLQGYVDNGMPSELVCEAIKRTREQGKVSIRYTYSILDDWRNRGIVNLAGVAIADQEFEQKKARGDPKKRARGRDSTGDYGRYSGNGGGSEKKKELIKSLYQ